MFKCEHGCVKHFSSFLSIDPNSTLIRGTRMKTSMFNQQYISNSITCPCFDVPVKTTFLNCELYQVNCSTYRDAMSCKQKQLIPGCPGCSAGKNLMEQYEVLSYSITVTQQPPQNGIEGPVVKFQWAPLATNII